MITIMDANGKEGSMKMIHNDILDKMFDSISAEIQGCDRLDLINQKLIGEPENLEDSILRKSFTGKDFRIFRQDRVCRLNAIPVKLCEFAPIENLYLCLSKQGVIRITCAIRVPLQAVVKTADTLSIEPISFTISSV